MATKTTAQRTRDVPLQVRITPQERDAYKAAAEADGRTLSNWVRERLNAAAESKSKPRAVSRPG